MNSAHAKEVFNAIECAVLFISGAVAAGCAIFMTPLAFWLPAWAVLGLAFGVAWWRREGGHCPSTVFGLLEAAYMVALVVLLARGGLSPWVLMHLGFGLLFVHGLLYLIAAKPLLIRRGWLKPREAGERGGARSGVKVPARRTIERRRR